MLLRSSSSSSPVEPVSRAPTTKYRRTSSLKLVFLLLCPTCVYHSPPSQIAASDQLRFGGDAAPNSTTEPAEEQSYLESAKMRMVEFSKSFVIDMWLARQTPEKVLPIVQNVLDGAKEEFADAVANGGGVYGVGYCFGAKYILILAGERPDTQERVQTASEEEEGTIKKGPQLKAGAIAHGTMITKEDITAIKVPVSMACVENDQLFPDEVREEGKAALEKSAVEHEIKVYSGVPHGFAVLGDYEDEKIKTSQQHAYEQMLGWLQVH